MTRVSSRVALRTPRRWVLMGLIVVGTVMVGALAMHSVVNSSVTMVGESTAGATTSARATASPDGRAATAAEGIDSRLKTVSPSAGPADAPCTSACVPEWMMTGMLCALAILTIVLAALLLPRGSRTSARLLFLRVASLISGRVRIPPPPSLIALSISRT